MNPKVNGQIQTHWRWLIAAYLFLGGVGAGAYTVAAVNTFLGKVLEPSTIVGLWISFPALIIGSLCLLADLGQPTKAVLAGMRPGTSWISRVLKKYRSPGSRHTRTFSIPFSAA